MPGLEWRAPVRQGDVYNAALSRPAIIGIIDGYFEVVPTVWHKEILWAMAQGIHVYGAASIGALRAAELADFGMRGIGSIYEQFRDGILDDDDEVAVLHGPAEVGYVQLTEAMVNVRATIEQALSAGVLDDNVATRLQEVAKGLFYKNRTYGVILEKAAELGLPADALDNFAAWLPTGCADQKRTDALAMIAAIGDHLARGVSRMETQYHFEHTVFWEDARQKAGKPRPTTILWRIFFPSSTPSS
jgi:hypothetical protein